MATLKLASLERFFNSLPNFIDFRLLPIIEFLIYLRVPLAIAITSFLIFSQVDQTLEIYRAIAEDEEYLKATIATLLVSILAFTHQCCL